MKKKNLDRVLGALIKSYDIKTAPSRQGKLYSHKYLLSNEAVKNYQPPEKHVIVKIEATNENVRGPHKLDEDPISLNNSKAPVQVLNGQVFKTVLSVIEQNKNFLEFFKQNIDNIENLRDLEYGTPKYLEKSEKAFILLLENERKFNGLDTQPKASKGYSKTALTRSKLDRFIFILNKINENEVITNIMLKNYIKNELELGKGFTIDRKTLKALLKFLESFGLIKLLDHKYTFISNKKLQNFIENKEDEMMYTRIVVLAPHVDDKDPRIKTLLDNTNINQLKKESEAPTKKKRKFKAEYDEDEEEEPEDLFYSDEEDDYKELKPKVDKKVKTNGASKLSDIENQKNIFEAIEGDHFEKLKKFDFDSCKVLSKESKAMNICMYFEKLFSRKKKIQTRFSFSLLKKIALKEILSGVMNTTHDINLSYLLKTNQTTVETRKKILDVLKRNSHSFSNLYGNNHDKMVDHQRYEISCSKIESLFYQNLECEYIVNEIMNGVDAFVDAPMSKYTQDNADFSSITKNDMNLEFLEEITRDRNYDTIDKIDDSNSAKSMIKRFSDHLYSGPIKSTWQFLNKINSQQEGQDLLQILGVIKDVDFKKIYSETNIYDILPSKYYPFKTNTIKSKDIKSEVGNKSTYMYLA